jgi:3-deoxy-7-phosphoheptulonate synthase
MARAAVACGADGLIVEVHHDPENSWTSDGKQSLLPEQFAMMVRECKAIAAAIGREI